MDANFHFDVTRSHELRRIDRDAFKTDKKYIRRCKLSLSALVKILNHAQVGVDQGRDVCGFPVEIYGILVGFHDPNDDRIIIIQDAWPLPGKLGEPAQVDDEYTDPAKKNHLSEMLYHTSSSNHLYQVGNYHSHPFEPHERYNSFWSGGDYDCITEGEKLEGVRFKIGVVLDPQSTSYSQKPILQAFCAYYDYVDDFNVLPDGAPVGDPKAAHQRWGKDWMKYYMLDMEFFSSTLSERAIANVSSSQNSVSFMSILTRRQISSIAGSQKRISNEFGCSQFSSSQFSSIDGSDMPESLLKTADNWTKSQILHSYGQFVKKSLTSPENSGSKFI